MPIELDQIYESLDTLNVALGPNGANRNGALSDLLAVTADNFDGQGANLRSTLGNFARLTATLDNNKEELFGSAERLGKFVSTLAENDQTVRSFNQSLSDVSGLLEGEKEELSASLRNLSVALTEVSSLRQGEPRDPRAQHLRAQPGLQGPGQAARRPRRDPRVGPLALNNLALTYNPQAGTLDTRANIGELVNQLSADPATYLCGLTSQVKGAESVCDTIKQVLPRAGALPKGPLPARPGQRFDPSWAASWRCRDEAPAGPRAPRRDRADPVGVRLRRLQAAAARRPRRRRPPDDGDASTSATSSTWCPSRRSRSTT